MDFFHWKNDPALNPIALWGANIPLWREDAPAEDGGFQGEPTITPYQVDNMLRSAVVVCPGGGYGMKASHEAIPIAQWLNAGGIHAFVLNYRVAPFRHPAPLEDALRAIRYVRAHAEELHVDPNRIGILGFSAGGHLAATASTLFGIAQCLDPQDPVDTVSSRPDAAVLCYPVISMKDEITHRGSRKNLVGEDAETSQALALSAELHVTDQNPPTFLWHTADDEAVPIANSLGMATALTQHHVTTELHVFPHGSHGLGLAQDVPVVCQWPQLAMDFLHRIGF